MPESVKVVRIEALDKAIEATDVAAQFAYAAAGHVANAITASQEATNQMRTVIGTYNLGRAPQVGDPAGNYRVVMSTGTVDVAWNGKAETGRTPVVALAEQIKPIEPTTNPLALNTVKSVTQRQWRQVAQWREVNPFWLTQWKANALGTALAPNLAQPEKVDVGLYSDDRMLGTYNFAPYQDILAHCMVITPEFIRYPYRVFEIEALTLPNGPIAELRLGAAFDGGNWIQAIVDIKASTSRLELQLGGGGASVVGAVMPLGITVGAGKYAVEIAGTCMNLWYTPVGKTQAIPLRTWYMADKVDFQPPNIAESWRFAFGFKQQGQGSMGVIGNIRAGMPGQVGTRDFAWVVNDDGSILERDGWVYFTGTSGGIGLPGGPNNAQAYPASHQGVYRLRPGEWTTIEKAAIILFRRDGRVVGDHAAELVWDRATNKWLVGATRFGDADIDNRGPALYSGESTDDLLTGVHRIPVIEMVPLARTTNAWDGRRRKINGEWRWVFTLPDLTSHIAIGVCPLEHPHDFDTTRTAYRRVAGQTLEGTNWLINGRQWFIVAGETNGGVKVFQWDKDFPYIGEITLPAIPSPDNNGVPAQHWGVAAIPRGDQTQYVALGFDVAQVQCRGANADGSPRLLGYTWGNLYVFAPVYGDEAHGWEFERLPMLR